MNDSIEPELISQNALRTILGALGLSLPFILPFGTLLFGSGPNDIWQASISEFYYTNMGDVFVGVLWAFGLFLFTYKGYPKSLDNTLTNIAGILSICVAIFPTTQATVIIPEWIEWVHFGSAALFFLILGYISLFIFTKGNSKSKNALFRICGMVIWGSLLILLVYFLTKSSLKWPDRTVFWFEAFCLWAFGFSWITKGNAMKWIGLK